MARQAQQQPSQQSSQQQREQAAYTHFGFENVKEEEKEQKGMGPVLVVVMSV